ncbi:MAG: protein kinase [Chloroflexota bacterium]
MPEWNGQIIGKVRIEQFLARGGMAEVYLATHLTLERPVAVKVLHSYIESDPDLLARFHREAKVVAGLRHPNIVQVYDLDTYEGHPYIVMEYLRGPSLSTYLKRLHEKNEKLSYEQIANLLGALASGIDYAHAQGVIHRDIKPANILLHNKSRDFANDSPITKSTEPIITDFGLVRIAHSSNQTKSGLVSGTPNYMSPEQARGDKVDYRTDIYSLGVVLYELLAGRVPFEGDSTMAVIYKHIHEPPPPIKDLPPGLHAVIDRALAKDPRDRYQSTRDMAADFYEAIGMHAEAETMHSLRVRTPLPAARPKRRDPVWMTAGIFTCACAATLLLGAVGISAVSLGPRLLAPRPTAPVTEIPVGNFIPNTSSGPVGILRFQNGTAAMDQITINATLEFPPENMHYEAWGVDDDRELSQSLGTLQQNSEGQFVLTYIAPQSENLLALFNRMEISLEPSPDDSPNSSRQIVYSSSIPPESLEHIRHLMVGTDETPNHIAVAAGLIDNVTLIEQAADAMLQAYELGDRASMRSSAEAIVNLIVGKEDFQFYSDWDANGTLSDPGDGYGLLINGGQAGYLDGMIHHASYSAKASGATSEIQLHAEHVEVCTQNLETWAPQLRDLALFIARSTDGQDVEADVRKANALAHQMLEGIDLDGNESVDPIAGEGGAITAFEHAEYMSDMPIFAGENQVPPP